MSGYRYLLLLVLVCLLSCGNETKPLLSADDIDETGMPDLMQIEEAGELIVTTVNGPDTYYEYHNTNMGLQYLMAENFANSLGLRIRVEVAADTAEMISNLKTAKADIIACELPEAVLSENGLAMCGANSTAGGYWAVRSGSVELKDELNRWYNDNVRTDVLAMSKNAGGGKYKSRKVYAAFSNKSKGIVSNYDMLFAEASRLTGWDWKLLASQCYQESGFDPNAVSWAGARGLMQIMPSTAKGYGVSPDDLFNPQVNMSTAIKVINRLEGNFKEISNPTERKKFVLAAYNGGFGHISDAMRLARKYKKNPHSWDDVSYFVLHLSEPQYYKDPVVKYGYMVGRETFNYVNAVMGRWNGYHAVLRDARPKGENIYNLSDNNHKANRFSKRQTIVGKDDSLFSVKR